jgi:hypothetical protein
MASLWQILFEERVDQDKGRVREENQVKEEESGI